MGPLTEFRKKYRLSMTQCATLFGCSNQAWSSWEKGNVQNRSQYIEAHVRQILNLNLDDQVADRIPSKLAAVGGARTLQWIYVQGIKPKKESSSNRRREGPLPPENLPLEVDLPAERPPHQ